MNRKSCKISKCDCLCLWISAVLLVFMFALLIHESYSKSAQQTYAKTSYSQAEHIEKKSLNTIVLVGFPTYNTP